MATVVYVVHVATALYAAQEIAAFLSAHPNIRNSTVPCDNKFAANASETTTTMSLRDAGLLWKPNDNPAVISCGLPAIFTLDNLKEWSPLAVSQYLGNVPCVDDDDSGDANIVMPDLNRMVCIV